MTPVEDFEVRTYRKVDVRIVPFLFFCYILAYLDRVNVGFAKLQMLKDLSMSDAAFATGAGIFFIGYFFFEVPSNVLLKKFGARTWIARIMISWGVISACMIFVKGEWSFYAMRFFLGLAEAGFFPGVIFYLTLWYPSRLRSTRTAWFVAAIAVSGVVGNPISGWIMDTFSGAMKLSRKRNGLGARKKSCLHVTSKRKTRKKPITSSRMPSPAGRSGCSARSISL
jgi:MFS family permease